MRRIGSSKVCGDPYTVPIPPTPRPLLKSPAVTVGAGRAGSGAAGLGVREEARERERVSGIEGREGDDEVAVA